MSNTSATTPTHSNEPTAPDYAVPNPQDAWERMGRLVDKVLETPSKTSVGKLNNSPPEDSHEFSSNNPDSDKS